MCWEAVFESSNVHRGCMEKPEKSDNSRICTGTRDSRAGQCQTPKFTHLDPCSQELYQFGKCRELVTDYIRP